MPNGDTIAAEAPDSGAEGFALPIVLLAIAVGGISLTTAWVPAQHRIEREQETELRFRGNAYAQAIRSFYLAEPDVRRRRLPKSFDELTTDPRFSLRKHMRCLYADPLFPPEKEQAFRAIQGTVADTREQGILGVASTSNKELLDRTPAISSPTAAPVIKKASDLHFIADFGDLMPKNANSRLLQRAPASNDSLTRP